MTTQVFEANFSPTSAFWVLQHAVHENKQFPIVAAILRDNFYADNLCDSFESEEEAIKFSKDAIESLALGEFRHTAFTSSSKKVLASIPASERSNPFLNLDLEKLPIEYLLGMVWDCNTDCYRIRIKKIEPVFTKRQMLAAMSRAFDPLWAFLPITTRAKELFQVTWREKRKKTTIVNGVLTTHFEPIGWDEQLPATVLTQ